MVTEAVLQLEIPTFDLPSTKGRIKSEDLQGHPSILVFYPEDNTPVCANQLTIYNEAMRIFERYNATIVAISIDCLESHTKFADKLNLKYPLISDDEPKGALAKAFGVYDEEREITKRAIFIFDEGGKQVFREVYPDHVNPGADGILRTLAELKTINRVS